MELQWNSIKKIFKNHGFQHISTVISCGCCLRSVAVLRADRHQRPKPVDPSTGAGSCDAIQEGRRVSWPLAAKSYACNTWEQKAIEKKKQTLETLWNSDLFLIFFNLFHIGVPAGAPGGWWCTRIRWTHRKCCQACLNLSWCGSERVCVQGIMLNPAIANNSQLTLLTSFCLDLGRFLLFLLPLFFCECSN